MKKNALCDLFFPPHCPFCDKRLDRWMLLCNHCQEKLPWTPQGKAPHSGAFFSQCISPLWYRDTVPESIQRYKFHGKKYYGKHYAALMAQCVEDRLQQSVDLITWVPISKPRRQRRGYDQGEVMARALGTHLNLPVIGALKKIRDNPPQSSLEEESTRRANVLGAYAMGRSGSVAEKTVLLVDDVVTTGSTLSECARTLRMAGAKAVVCVTVAQAHQ